MREPLQPSLPDDEMTLVVNGEEATLVSPRFDDEETLVARPVVPLEVGAQAPPRKAQPPAPRQTSKDPRRTGALALVLVSVLIGGVLGGAGLYLYQRQTQDSVANPNATAQPAAQTTEAEAAPKPAAPAAQQPEATATTEPVSETPHSEEPAAVPAQNDGSAPAHESESAPVAAERRNPSTEDSAPKHGKKGARDQEIERRNAPRPDNIARDDNDDAPEARRVDTIFARPRRATRRERARRDDTPDRLRRIFEGGPEQ